jgi:hypothetical protein
VVNEIATEASVPFKGVEISFARLPAHVVAMNFDGHSAYIKLDLLGKTHKCMAVIQSIRRWFQTENPTVIFTDFTIITSGQDSFATDEARIEGLLIGCRFEKVVAES